MVTELRLLDESYPAYEDLRDYQYHFVVLNSSGQVRLPDNGGECPLGILQNKPYTGEAAVVREFGRSKLVANDTLAIGTFVRPEYVGAADAGKGQDATSYEAYARAIVVEAAGTEDDLCSVLLMPGRPPGTFAVSEITLADGKVIVGMGDDVGRAVTPAGDVTMTNSGATAIGANKILTAMISDAQVTEAKLASACLSALKSYGESYVTSHVLSSAH